MNKKLFVVLVLVALFVSVSVTFAESEVRFLDLGLFGACKVTDGVAEFPRDCRLTGFSLEEISSNGMTLSFRIPVDGWVDTGSSMTPFINGEQKDFGVYSDLPNRDDNIIFKDGIVQLKVSRNASPDSIWFRIVFDDLK